MYNIFENMLKFEKSTAEYHRHLKNIFQTEFTMQKCIMFNNIYQIVVLRHYKYNLHFKNPD